MDRRKPRRSIMVFYCISRLACNTHISRVLNQEDLARQMMGIFVKESEEALAASYGRWGRKNKNQPPKLDLHKEENDSSSRDKQLKKTYYHCGKLGT
ncbi:hypothetical protein AMTR_s00027p00080260 [Amborella trichopoda]|uniref:Uncharacterized protein n=1 Tax=Amborella trichopoda TaxID=13333 RepID=W1PTW5_AMBTC|nr:hypothetical protein AMTR_s00027p00080260 [Amborella trichopoda]